MRKTGGTGRRESKCRREAIVQGRHGSNPERDPTGRRRISVVAVHPRQIGFPVDMILIEFCLTSVNSRIQVNEPMPSGAAQVADKQLEHAVDAFTMFVPPRPNSMALQHTIQNTVSGSCSEKGRSIHTGLLHNILCALSDITERKGREYF